ncbi:hypothetical protein [Streptomyces sp. NPDC060184]|uniref:hypothetical protein n=1 Tax=Streptomyces sp. NPDC060184 TaxID=3347064 RepID=UPI003665C48D
MTYGSSTNGERMDGERTGGERSGGAADARRTDDRTRTAFPEPSGAVPEPSGAAPESAAGPRPLHAPETAGSPAGRTDRNLAGDRADRPADGTGTTDAAAPDRTGTLGAKRDPDRVDGVDGVGRTHGTDRTDPVGRAGTRREASGARTASGTAAHDGHGLDHADGALLGGTDHDELERRMRHAVSDFVEDPRRAVREAGETLDAVTQNLVKALTDRSTALRSEEQADDAGGQNGERTEQLRIVLQHYRDLTDRLLAV